jgi:hypothetical protein
MTGMSETRVNVVAKAIFVADLLDTLRATGAKETTPEQVELLWSMTASSSAVMEWARMLARAAIAALAAYEAPAPVAPDAFVIEQWEPEFVKRFRERYKETQPDPANPGRILFLHDSALCKDEQCRCHTTEEFAVSTPFPEAMGTQRANPFCCNLCAIVR